MNKNFVVIASVLTLSQITQFEGEQNIPTPSVKYKYASQNHDYIDKNNNSLISISSYDEGVLVANFIENIINNSKDLDLEFAQIIEDDFWNLIDNE